MVLYNIQFKLYNYICKELKLNHKHAYLLRHTLNLPLIDKFLMANTIGTRLRANDRLKKSHWIHDQFQQQTKTTPRVKSPR